MNNLSSLIMWVGTGQMAMMLMLYGWEVTTGMVEGNGYYLWADSQGLHLTDKCFPLYNLPPKMAAAFQGLITNAGLMAAGMSYSYSSQKQTTSLYVYIWRHW